MRRKWEDNKEKKVNNITVVALFSVHFKCMTSRQQFLVVIQCTTNLNNFQSLNELICSGEHQFIGKLPLFNLLSFLEEFLDVSSDIFKVFLKASANLNRLLRFLISFFSF